MLISESIPLEEARRRIDKAMKQSPIAATT
jgi:hypothetical protein